MNYHLYLTSYYDHGQIHHVYTDDADGYIPPIPVSVLRPEPPRVPMRKIEWEVT